jgi:hypothetical protein
MQNAIRGTQGTEMISSSSQNLCRQPFPRWRMVLVNSKAGIESPNHNLICCNCGLLNSRWFVSIRTLHAMNTITDTRMNTAHSFLLFWLSIGVPLLLRAEACSK